MALRASTKRLKSFFDMKLSRSRIVRGDRISFMITQVRAVDLVMVFGDHTIKGIFANIHREDSIRLLPYIDFDMIREHPKLFMGYSSVPISYLFCHKSWYIFLSSISGVRCMWVGDRRCIAGYMDG